MPRDCERELDCGRPVQAIRIVDVLLLGPAMIVVGSREGGVLGSFVAAAGVATMAFNAGRFMRARKS